MCDDRSIPSYLFDFEKNKKKGIFYYQERAWGTGDTFIIPFFKYCPVDTWTHHTFNYLSEWDGRKGSSPLRRRV